METMEMDPELREMVSGLLLNLWAEAPPKGGVQREAVTELSRYMLSDFGLDEEDLPEVEALHLEVLQELGIEIIEDGNS